MFLYPRQKVIEGTKNDVGALARVNAAFGQGIGPVILTYPVCTGLEYRFLDCPRSSLNTCGHQYDAGVECTAGQAAPCIVYDNMIMSCV